ncbi:CHAT domain-containing tetratricopeptide repeat protein [Gloeobacter kilaueensis]|uniref:CHAT domain-containing tetratricopeptide repeat protein n=1 Tax=Gloeobacter kilaueensis TaxID=1416614 RepID=UPI000417A531|nr:CHAT domain-containing protein [Gloeobacter kilaueensis]
MYEQSIRLQEMGQYGQAQPLSERALAIREKVLGPEHPEVAQSLNDLASLYYSQGNYAGAEPLYGRTLAILEKVRGPEHQDVAMTLSNLAVLYADQGDYARAEPLYRRALTILEKVRGPEHPVVAVILGNLAILYSSQGNDAEAEPLYRRALAILEKVRGPEHQDVAMTLNNLAILYTDRGDYTGAEPLLKRALTIWQKVLGPEHRNVAANLNNLARLYRERGEYTSADALFQRGLAIFEKALGPRHPYVIESLFELSLLRLGQNRLDDARQILQQILDIQEDNLTLNLPAASQPRSLAYLRSLKEAADFTLWLHLSRLPTDPQAARLALATILSRKGRVLEEATLALARLRLRLPANAQQPLQQLADTRAQLASLVFQQSDLPPEQYQTQVRALRAQVHQLEDSLVTTGGPPGAFSRPLTLQAVQQALPKDAVLVEFVLYRPFELQSATPAQHFGAPRYAAYLLSPTGSPLGVDLGDARQIDRLVDTWRGWLLDPTAPVDGPVRKLARLLYKKLLAPLASHLQVKHLLIAPDGQLNTVPFAALIGPDGHFLLQAHTLTYLVSGRELPRLAQVAPPTPRSAPLVVGGPDFGRAGPAPFLAAQPVTGKGQAAGKISEIERPRSSQENLRSSALAGFTVQPLPGARAEATAVARLLGTPTTRLLIGAQATENALKATHSPALLHLATHGFFLEDQDSTENEADSQEPLLRSGVALAGFNVRSSGSEDGVLTALEAQGLDLEGTELAVISACQSGAGPVVGGEGVQGLRRALALAGTRSQMLALWAVGDRTTAELMKRFYKRLAAGAGRSEALRQAQLAILNQPQRSHPFWWASFAASGDWRPVQLPRHGHREAGAVLPP